MNRYLGITTVLVYMADRNELRRAVILVGLLILILPLLMMSLIWSMMGGMMGPMGGSAFLGILPLLLALGIGYAGYKFVTSAPKQDDVSTEDTSDPVERLQLISRRSPLPQGVVRESLILVITRDTVSRTTTQSAHTDKKHSREGRSRHNYLPSYFILDCFEAGFR